MFLVNRHLHFSALTQTVVGKMVEISCTHSAAWMGIVSAKGKGVQQHGWLFATNLGAKKAEPTSPLPRKQLASYTGRGNAQGLVRCWIPGVSCFFISEVNLKGS